MDVFAFNLLRRCVLLLVTKGRLYSSFLSRFLFFEIYHALWGFYPSLNLLEKKTITYSDHDFPGNFFPSSYSPPQQYRKSWKLYIMKLNYRPLPSQTLYIIYTKKEWVKILPSLSADFTFCPSPRGLSQLCFYVCSPSFNLLFIIVFIFRPNSTIKKKSRIYI